LQICRFTKNTGFKVFIDTSESPPISPDDYIQIDTARQFRDDPCYAVRTNRFFEMHVSLIFRRRAIFDPYTSVQKLDDKTNSAAVHYSSGSKPDNTIKNDDFTS